MEGYVFSFRLLVPLKGEPDDHLMDALSSLGCSIILSLIHLPCAFWHFSSWSTENNFRGQCNPSQNELTPWVTVCNISCGFSLSIKPPSTLLSTVALWKHKAFPWSQKDEEPTVLHTASLSPSPSIQVSTGQSPVSSLSTPSPIQHCQGKRGLRPSTYNTAPARHMQWFITVNMPVWPFLMLFICVWSHISLSHALPATHAVLQAHVTTLLHMSRSSLLKIWFLSYFKVTQKICNLFFGNKSRWISWSESY